MSDMTDENGKKGRPRPIVGTLAYILSPDRSKVLLVHRTYRESDENLGKWNGVGGHLERGEDVAACMEREILEETGLLVSVDTRFREVTTYSPAPGVMKDVVFFVARAANTRTTPQPTEVESIAFLPLEKALTRLTYESDREVVRRADSYLSK